MLCPNCSENLKSVEYDNQTILHCSNCGGSFFEENSINRITPDTAKLLARDQKSPIISGKQKICPRDNIFLHLIENDEAIPQNVMLFKCDKCHGVFAYPEDVLNFKKAQDIKIEFFKVWGNPLPSLKAVLVLIFFGVISFTVLTSISNLQNTNITSSKASGIIQGLNMSHTTQYLFISFRTEIPYKSKITFTDNSTRGKPITLDISTTPTKLHYITTTNVNVTHYITYQITLIDDEGKEIVTQPQQLELSPTSSP